MPKNWTKRSVHCYGEQAVSIAISVYGYNTLTTDELKRLGDHLADDAMKSINGAPFLNVPLSRITVGRPRQ